MEVQNRFTGYTLCKNRQLLLPTVESKE